MEWYYKDLQEWIDDGYDFKIGRELLYIKIYSYNNE